MQDVAEITSFVIIKEGSAAFQRYLPPKHTLHGVVFAKMIVCPWHIHITPDANALFSLLQRAPAYSTLTREEEMDKGQEPGLNVFSIKKCNKAIRTVSEWQRLPYLPQKQRMQRPVGGYDMMPFYKVLVSQKSVT